jgi:hypothetical protein
VQDHISGQLPAHSAGLRAADRITPPDRRSQILPGTAGARQRLFARCDRRSWEEGKGAFKCTDVSLVANRDILEIDYEIP